MIRTPAYPIDPIFLERWSPRAYDGSAIPDADLHTLFEAARWAPSAFNWQPWRFLYAKNGDANWARFLDLLVPFNQSWVKTASVLIYVVSDRMIETIPGEPKPAHTHSFDAGAAWMSLALQAIKLGYHAHGMAGVDYERAGAALGVPERFRLEAAVAVGRIGDPATLDEKLRAREFPSDRRPQAEFVFAGDFPTLA